MRTVLIVSLLLGGCALNQATTAEKAVAEQGALIADNVRDSAIFMLCKGMTVGTWTRAYGNDAKKAMAWRELCGSTQSETPGK